MINLNKFNSIIGEDIHRNYIETTTTTIHR